MSNESSKSVASRCCLHARLFNGIDITTVDRKMTTGEIEPVNDNASNVRAFFRANPTLLKLGGARSVENTYLGLWSIIYDDRYYGSCDCDDVLGGLRHTITDLSTYPRFSHGDWENDLTMGSEWTEASIIGDTYSRSFARSLSNSHLIDSPFDRQQPLIEMTWFCTVTISVKRPIFNVTKLLDCQHENPRDVWCMIGRVIAWCDDVYAINRHFPVRRALWDLLVVDGTELIPCAGLTDVGDLAAFVFSVRILLLIFYVGCTYGGISRVLPVNERVSNKRHECLLPPKTPGVYHSLFATSKVPHRLICGSDGRSTAAKNENGGSSVSQSVSAIAWLNEFRALYDRACERYGVPFYRWHFLTDFAESRETMTR